MDFVTVEDLEKLLQILEHADGMQSIGFEGAFEAFVSSHRAMGDEIRSFVLKLFVQFLFGQGEYANAKQLVKRFRSMISQETQAMFLAIETLLACQPLLQLANEIVTLCQLDIQLPEAGHLLSDPLLFHIPVKLVHQFSLGHITAAVSSSSQGKNSSSRATQPSADSNRRKLQATTYLKDINLSFTISAFSPTSLGWVDFQAFYLGYLTGTGNYDKLHEQTISLQYHLQEQRQQDQETNPQGILHCENLRLLLARLLLLFSTPDRHTEYMEEIVRLVLPLAATVNAACEYDCGEFYHRWFLYFHDLSSSEDFLRYVGDYLEHRGGDIAKNDDDHQAQYMVWKILAHTLGPLPLRKDSDAPLSSDHFSIPHIPEAVIAHQLFANQVLQDALAQRKIQEANKEDVIHNGHYPPERTYVRHFAREREWWLEHFLSASHLDIFSDAIIEYEMEDVLACVEDILTAQKIRSRRNSLVTHPQDEVANDMDEEEIDPQLGGNKDDNMIDIAHFHKIDAPHVYSSFRRGVQDYWCHVEEVLNQAIQFPDGHIASEAPTSMDFTGVIGKVDLPPLLVPLSSLIATTNVAKDPRNNDTSTTCSVDVSSQSQTFVASSSNVAVVRGDRPDSPETEEVFRKRFFVAELLASTIGKRGRKSLLSSSTLPDGNLLALYYRQLREEVGLPVHAFGRPRRCTVRIPDWFPSARKPTNSHLIRRAQSPTSKKSLQDQSTVVDETVYCLDSGTLETLTFQALVACHLADQDHAFPVRVVQILAQHVLRAELVNDNDSTAVECLAFLTTSQINLRRALAKGLEFACRDLPVDSSAPYFYTVTGISEGDGGIIGRMSMPKQANSHQGQEVYVEVVGNSQVHYRPVPFQARS